MASQHKFSIVFDASMDIGKVRTALQSMQGSLRGLKLPPSLNNNLERTFNNLSKEIDLFEAKTSSAFSSMADVNKATSSMQKIADYYSQLQIYLKRIGEIKEINADELFPEEVVNNIKKAQKALESYNKDLERQQELYASEQKKAKNTLERAQVNKRAKLDSIGVKDSLELEKKYQDALQKRNAIQQEYESKVGITSGKQYSALSSFARGLKEQKAAADAVVNELAKARNEIDNFDKEIRESQSSISQYTQKLQQITQAIETGKIDESSESFQKLRKVIAEIQGVSIDEIPNDLSQINQIVSRLSSEPLERIEKELRDIDNTADLAEDGIDKMNAELKETSSAASTIAKTASEVEVLKNRVADFFSISNSVELFKRTVRSAFNTVKELDAAMTDTAVVTDFSVGDMWGKLPQYTEAANELGATTQGAYETMTLYYQQGLETNEVFEIGAETMKMARIAGLDYAQTTDLMTAALRGFNMELNETSAKRINDVYSKLAAITASDTEEIATAMTKTASIADSAGMAFETTAAFLTQMIETTRESPENLGTALKTIIARFQEMKSAISNTFEVEGEVVDVNKVDTALRSIGVALKDTSGQFRNLDDVFLEVAEKWNTLDTMQQRYIATTAAGSRQQSRFIAMMNNYQRTLELVNAAENSSGASNKQFEKTMESLEAKLNELKNAWDEFALGIANDSLIKLGVDLLTGLLNVINDITGVFPGLLGSFAKLAVAWGGIKIGKKVFEGFFRSMGNAFVQGGRQAGDSFNQGINSSLGKTIQTNSFKSGMIAKNLFRDLKAAIKSEASTFEDITKVIGDKLKTLSPKLQKEFNKNFRLNNVFGNLSKDLQKGLQEQLNTSIAKIRVGDGIDDKLKDQFKNVDFSSIQNSLSGEIDQLFILLNNEIDSGNVDFSNLQQKLNIGLQNALNNAFNTPELSGLGEVGEDIKNKLQNAFNLGKIKLSTKTINTLSTSLEKMGSTAGRVGDAFNNLGTIFNNLGLNSVANVFYSIGSSISAVGGIVTTVGSLFTGLKASIEATGTSGLKAGIKIATGFLPVLIVIAAIIAAIAIIIAIFAIFNAIKANSLEGQIERLNKSIEKLKEQAEETKKELDDLFSKRDEYNELQDTLDQAISGTQEWSEALYKANQNVLDLLNTYPKLAQYVEKGADGQITITTEGWESVIKGQQKVYNDTLQSLMMEQYVRDSKEIQNKSIWEDRDNFGDQGEIGNLIKDFLRENSGNSDEKTVNALYDIITSDKLSKYLNNEKSFENLMNRYGITDKELDEETFKNFSKMTSEVMRVEGEILALRTQNEGRLASVLSTELEGEFYASKMADDLSAGFANLIDSADPAEAFDKKRDEIKGKSESDLQKMYAELFDVDLDEVKEKFKDDKDSLIDALASQLTTEEITDQFNIFIDSLAGSASDLKQKLANVLSKEGKLIDGDLLAEWAGEDLILSSKEAEAHLEMLAGDLNFDSAEDLAEKMGVSLEELIDLVTQNFKEANEALNEQREYNVRNMTQYYDGEWVDGPGGTIDQAMADYVIREAYHGKSFRGGLGEIYNSLEATGDTGLTKAGQDAYLQLAGDLSKEGTARLEEVNNLISNIDFSNPIQSISRLKQEIKEGTGTTKQFAQTLLNAGTDAFSASKQFKYLLQSSSWEAVSEQVADLKEETGELDANSIEELRDSCEDLDVMLEQTGLSTAGVARALNLLSNGSLTVDRLTESVMVALGSFDSLDSVVSSVLGTFSDFDPGIDEDEVAGFISDAAEKVNEKIAAGAYGNNQIDSYFDLLFGTDWDKNLSGSALIAKEKELAAVLQRNSANMFASWSGLVDNVDVYGNKISEKYSQVIDGITYLKDSATGQLGLGIDYVDGQIDLSNFEGFNSQQLVTQIMDAYGVTRTYAEAMLADFKNYSADFAQEMAENDYTSGIQKAYESLHKAEVSVYKETPTSHAGIVEEDSSTVKRVGVEVSAITTDAEIEAIATAAGQTYEKVLADYKKQGNLTVIDLIDEEGTLRSGSEIVAQLNQIFGNAEIGTGFLESLEGALDEGVADISVIQDALSNLGIPPELIDQLTVDLIEAYNNVHPEKPIEQMIMESSTGEKIEMPLNFDFESAFANANIEAEAKIMGEQISAALSNITVTFNGNETSFAGLKNQAMTSIREGAEAAQPEITVTIKNNLRQEVEDAVPDWTGITVRPTLSPSTLTLNVAGASKTITIDGHADGIKNSSTNHAALVGEEGPELWQTSNGQAFLVGMNGPELANIGKGDTVYTNEETKKIFKQRKHDAIPGFARGYGDVSSKTWWNGNVVYGAATTNYDSSSSTKTGTTTTTTTKKSDEWENPFDWLYNLIQEIEELTQERERLERDYNKNLKNRNTNAKKLQELSEEEIKTLEDKADAEAEFIKKRGDRITSTLSKSVSYEDEEGNKKSFDLSKYVKYDKDHNKLTIDWDKIDKIKDTALGEAVEEEIKVLEDYRDDIDDSLNSLEDIQDTIEEINERGKDETLDLEGRIIAALEGSRQDEIDLQQSISDTITETNQAIIDSMSKAIDRQRQERDNQRTEDELAEKQRRLAFLKQDTSGMYDLEIKQLEEELAQETEDYTDTLVDQAIQKMTEENDQAQQFRENQIKLMESLLQIDIETGKLVEQASVLMRQMVDSRGNVLLSSETIKLLKEQEDYRQMGEYEKQEWDEDYQNAATQSSNYLKNTNTLDKEIEKGDVDVGEKIKLTDGSGRTFSGTIKQASDGSSYVREYDQTYKKSQGFNILYDYKNVSDVTGTNQYGTDEERGEGIVAFYSDVEKTIKVYDSKGNAIKAKVKDGKITYGSVNLTSKLAYENGKFVLRNDKTFADMGITIKSPGGTTPPSNAPTPTLTANIKKGVSAAIWSGGYGWGTGSTRTARLKEVFGTNDIQSKYVDKGVMSGYSGKISDYSYKNMRKKFKGYKTGGIADYTGLAWLDGTPSKPEIILNQKDSNNFIQLKDILSSMFKNGKDFSENSGDNYYEVHINVDQIANDYDVDQLANRVKRIINEDARYRNVNSINRLR